MTSLRAASRHRQRHAACRRLLLCVATAAALHAWSGTAYANPFAAASASAASNGADASGSVDADFDRSLLAGSGQNTADLSRFERGNIIEPGSYNTDIYLNNAWVGRADVRFAASSPKANATPCVDNALLGILGLHLSKLSDATLKQLKDPSACVNIGSLIPDASMSFDMGNLRLDTSVPQAYLGQSARGYVSPEYWDHGVTAGILNYNFNGYRNESQGQTQTSAYLGLDAGLNLGPWYLRDNSTFDWESASAGAPAQHQWQTIQAYVQRDLSSLRAQLTIGDSFTDGQVFDSYGIRGVQLATDDRMLPQSLQGYAPVVQGVAQTNARVTVRQNGIQIYQTTVAPGPFTITDLYPTGYGGDLDVTVTEADGRTSTFSVPYASVAQLLRPGVTRFDIAVGTLRDVSLSHDPAVVQAAAQRGFSNLLTGYAGLVGSQGYAAALVGSAVNTRLGALALDVTEAHTHIPGQPGHAGQSVRVTYSKIIPETQTSLTVAADRYSTGGFYSLTDAATARDLVRRGLPLQVSSPLTVPTIDGVPEQSVLTPAQQAVLAGSAFVTNPIVTNDGLLRQKNSFTLTLSQHLGQHGGSLYANTSTNDYWNSGGTDTQFQVGYNNSFHRVSYNLSATRTRDALGRFENQYFISFSLPLGESPHAPTFTLNTSSGGGVTQNQAMVNGTLGADNQFNYGATASHGNEGTGNAATVNAGYNGPYAQINASYGNGSNYSQASFGMSGAIVAHPGGITFGQPMGDTVGIVYVPGAAGAKVENASGVRIDSAGYALVPYLLAYNLDTVQIDPKGLPLDVQLNSTSMQVAPYAGAVVMLKFKTENGRTLIVSAHQPNGEAVPFGAQVFNAKGSSLGVVGQAGQMLVRGVDQSGELFARWQDGQGASHACSFAYHLKPKAKGKATKIYDEMSTTCVPADAQAQVNRSGA